MSLFDKLWRLEIAIGELNSFFLFIFNSMCVVQLRFDEEKIMAEWEKK